MRYSIILIIGLLCWQQSLSQIYEIGLFVGGSNLISDVGATNYINPSEPAIGGVLKWNRSPRHAWRVSLIYSNVEALDSKSDDPRRVERDLKYANNSFLEFSAGIEFTFFDFDLHTGENLMTPYLYSGVTVLYHDNYYFTNNVQTFDGTTSWDFGIPMVVGLKTTLSDHLILYGEVGARYSFTDNLDGSFPESSDLQNFRFGNLNNNDWYTFTGVGITYTFGRRPCYCNF